MKKFLKTSLLLCFCFAFITIVFAKSATLEYNQSVEDKKEVGVDFYTRVNVKDLSINHPTIRNKVQAKKFLGWESGTSQSFVAESTNSIYFINYNQTKTNTIKSTWTNMTAGTRIGGEFDLLNLE